MSTMNLNLVHTDVMPEKTTCHLQNAESAVVS